MCLHVNVMFSVVTTTIIAFVLSILAEFVCMPAGAINSSHTVIVLGMRPKAVCRWNKWGGCPAHINCSDYDIIVSKYSQPHHLVLCTIVWRETSRQSSISSWLSLGTYCLTNCRGDELLLKLWVILKLDVRLRFDELGEASSKVAELLIEICQLLICQASHCVVQCMDQ